MRSVEQVHNDRIIELSNIELIGVDDTEVSQNDFGDSQTLTVESDGEAMGGYIKLVTLIATTDDAGAILANAIDLYFFRADPEISAGDADLPAADAAMLIGKIEILEGDWDAWTNSAIASLAVEFPFHTDASGRLFVAAVNRSATAFNDGGTDDEVLELTLLIDRTD